MTSQSTKPEAFEQEQPAMQPPSKDEGLEVPWRVTGTSACSKVEAYGLSCPQVKSVAKNAPTQEGSSTCVHKLLPSSTFLIHSGLGSIDVTAHIQEESSSLSSLNYIHISQNYALSIF